MESHFCDPEELERILRARDAETGRNQFATMLPAFRQQTTAPLSDYVAHWALCRVIQQANERIRKDTHYPAFFKDKCPLPSEAEIQAKLGEWSDVLEPSRLFNAFVALRADSMKRPVGEQFRACIESKLFFGKVVMEGPNGLVTVSSPASNSAWPSRGR